MKLKLKAAIISLISVLLLAVVGIGCYCLWPAITATIKDEKFYTQTEIQESYNNGYSDGCKNSDALTAQIDYYKNLIDESVYTLNNEIAALTAQNDTQKQEYEKQLNDKENLIKDLNSQIISLKNQINEMAEFSQNAGTQIAALNNRINDLQASIDYYENFIAGLENNEQCTATYEIDGVVWKIEIFNKGSEITLTKPADTETRIINGWTVNGESVGNTYTLNQNTKFVANVVHKFQVQFINGDQIHNSQLVIENRSAELPESPSKAGYEFLGWSKNGVDVIKNIDTISVTENTTYYAVFVKLHTVTFVIDEQVIATQTVKNGNCAQMIDTGSQKVSEWIVNGVSVNVETYKIYSDTVYVAYFGLSGLQRFTWNGLSYANEYQYDGSCIWTDGINYYYSGLDAQYQLNSATHTWEKIRWDGITDLYGDNVWTDGVDYYCSAIYSSYTPHQYKLNIGTHTWEKMTWYGLSNFNGKYVWTDGVNYYYSYESQQYKLDIAEHTWRLMNWNGLSNFKGNYVWTDGVNYYYSYESQQYKLDIAEHRWEAINWNGLSRFDGDNVWTDGVDYYYSSTGTTITSSFQYKLDITTNTWKKMEWDGLSKFDGKYVWTDGVDYYLWDPQMDINEQYVFVRQR